MREALLDPTGGVRGGQDARLAPRPVTLEGARLGLLNSTKPNSAVLLEQLAELLKAEQKVGEVTLFSKPSFAVPAPDALLDEIAARCDVVLAGVGD